MFNLIFYIFIQKTGTRCVCYLPPLANWRRLKVSEDRILFFPSSVVSRIFLLSIEWQDDDVCWVPKRRRRRRRGMMWLTQSNQPGKRKKVWHPLTSHLLLLWHFSRSFHPTYFKTPSIPGKREKNFPRRRKCGSRIQQFVDSYFNISLPGLIFLWSALSI